MIKVLLVPRTNVTATQQHKPTKEELGAAVDRLVPDVIAPDLKVLFCGINPGLYSAATAHHFARPGNRFWPALHAGGFTPRVLKPWEDAQLLRLGYGITNVVERASLSAAELTPDEIVEGGRRLEAKVRQYRPRCLAVLGITAYRTAFHRPKAVLGPQPDRIGDALVWVLPNPSGLNAHYHPKDLARLFGELRATLESIT
jgi:TDG/mug DNA glycosylase family protein